MAQAFCPTFSGAFQWKHPENAMTHFQRVLPNPLGAMIKRERLLAAPAEAYRDVFHGRVPTLQEKFHYVELVIQNTTAFEIYHNDTYRVELRRRPPFVHLAIHRLDAQACSNWRHFQQIKNELVGPENEAIEIFPAESRLVDNSNQYHLWVFADPSFRIPAGFNQRFVTEKPLETLDPVVNGGLRSFASSI